MSDLKQYLHECNLQLGDTLKVDNITISVYKK